MGKQLIQDVEVRNAKVSQGVIVDLNPATEPAKAVVMRAQPGHSPGAADALNSGLQPQGHQDLRIDRGPAGPAFHGSNALEQGRQVEPLDKLPDRAGRVFGGHQVLQGHGRQPGLPIGTAQARLRLGDSSGGLPVVRWGLGRRIGVRHRNKWLGEIRVHTLRIHRKLIRLTGSWIISQALSRISYALQGVVL